MNGVVVTDAIKFVQTNKEKITMACKEGIKESKEPDYDVRKIRLRKNKKRRQGNSMKIQPTMFSTCKTTL